MSIPATSDLLVEAPPQPTSLSERAILKRFGILMLATLGFWPFLGFWSKAAAIVVNGLLLDTYFQLGFLTMVNVVAFFFCFAILRLQNQRLGGHFWTRVAGDGESPWGWRLVGRAFSFSMLTPLILALFFGSEFPTTAFMHFAKSLFWIAAGGAASMFGLLALGWLKSLLFGSDITSANYFPFEARAKNGIEPFRSISGWLTGKAESIGLQPIDVQFMIYLTLLAAIHYGAAHMLEANEYWLTSAPSMFVVLIWLSFMLLAGLANMLDRYRIPILLSLILMVAVLLGFRDATRPFHSIVDNSKNNFVAKIAKIRDREDEFLRAGLPLSQRPAFIAKQTASLEDDAWRAISNRMQQLKPDTDQGKTLVVVTCPGGGIHAAAWAACVLDQLSMEYVEFKDSIAVISGVSGGSVGALLFVSSRYDSELLSGRVGSTPATTAETHSILKNASPALELAARSSLESIAYGMTVDDLYGMVGFPGSGRGQRLEDSFIDRLPQHQRSLLMGDWGDRALDGSVPIVIFNSTDAVSGRRVLFDTVPTPRRPSSVGLTARPLNYRELMESTATQSYDVSPATAARTSATFPYISPFTKPSRASSFGECVAICDGGYVDNEGIVSAVNWIEFLLRRWHAEKVDEKPFQRILLLRIEPAASEDRNIPSDPGGLAGWFRWLTGPVESMVKVRSASQLERGNLEADLAALYLRLDDSTPSSHTEPTGSILENSGAFPNDYTAQQNLVDLPELDPKQKSSQEIRETWDKMLDGFSSRPLTKREPQPPEPRAGAVIDNRSDEENSSPLVVLQTVRFINAEQTIPLNWKLSNRQKLGYLLAWELCAADETLLRSTLDEMFTPIEKPRD